MTTAAPRKRARTTTSSTTQKKTKAAIGRMVKTCMFREAEHKHVDINDALTPATGGTFGTNLLSLSNGTNNGTRIGSQVQVMSVEFRFLLQLPAAATGGGGRVILVLDHNPNGALPAVGDLLDAPVNFLAPYNLDKVGNKMMGPARFRILYDKIFYINPTSSVVAAGTAIISTPVHQRKFKITFPVHYGGVAGTVADLVKNNLFFLYIGINGTETLTSKTQVCYVDV